MKYAQIAIGALTLALGAAVTVLATMEVAAVATLPGALMTAEILGLPIPAAIAAMALTVGATMAAGIMIVVRAITEDTGTATRTPTLMTTAAATAMATTPAANDKSPPKGERQ